MNCLWAKGHSFSPFTLKYTTVARAFRAIRTFAVATRPIYKNSLFFLHGKAGSVQLGNVETVGAVTNVRSDAYKLIFKEEKNPFTDAYKLMFQYGLVAEGRDFLKKQNFIVFLNKGVVKAYDPFGLTPRFTAYKDLLCR